MVYTFTFQVHEPKPYAAKRRFSRRHRVQPEVVRLAKPRPQAQKASKSFVHPLLHRRATQSVLENP